MSTVAPSRVGGPRRLLGVNPVDHPGGAETTFVRLTRGLLGRRWRVSASTPTGGPLADALVAAGADWSPLATGGIGRRRGAAALVGSRALARRRPEFDVVYLNGAVCGRLLPALSAPAFGERHPTGPRPLSVLHVHDMVERVPRFWADADLLLAASQAVADRLSSLDPRLAPEAVGLPVDLDPPPADPAWSPGAGPTVGFVGRIEPRKGVVDLLAAWPEILAAAPEAQLVLIGDDPYANDPGYTREVLARAARLGAHHVPWHANAPGLMRHLDVLVLPSRVEPFGTVLAEAMAVGTPVVATAVDGLTEVVEDGHCGRLVPPRRPGALAAAVLDVLDHRAAMSAAARQRAQRWSSERYVAAMAARLEQRIGAAW